MKIKKGSIADELKAKARAAKDGEPAMMAVNGWVFGLSIGITPTPSREAFEAFYASVHERVGGGPKPTYEEMATSMEVARQKGRAEPFVDPLRLPSPSRARFEGG